MCWVLFGSAFISASGRLGELTCPSAQSRGLTPVPTFTAPTMQRYLLFLKNQLHSVQKIMWYTYIVFYIDRSLEMYLKNYVLLKEIGKVMTLFFSWASRFYQWNQLFCWMLNVLKHRMASWKRLSFTPHSFQLWTLCCTIARKASEPEENEVYFIILGLRNLIVSFGTDCSLEQCL